jgi:hypothetical protein
VEFGRYGHGPCHPGIAVTSADDQRLHAAGELHYWEGAADRALLRRGSMALLFAAYLLNDSAFVIIAATLARGGLINSDKCDIYACQPGLSARDALS